MFRKADLSDYRAPFAGVRFMSLVHGERTLLAEFRLSKGHVLPRHSHAHEQTGYLVSGHMVLTIGSEPFDVKPGDSWCIPGGVEHEARIIEDSVAIEVFSPVRDEYLERTTGS